MLPDPLTLVSRTELTKMYRKHKPCSYDTVRMQFDHDSRMVRDHHVIVRGSIVIRDFKLHLKFEQIEFASNIFGCTRRIFLLFVTAEPPFHLAMCEQTSDYSHRFITVTARQPQL